MKKQTDTITTTSNRPWIKKIELIFLVIMATIIYRNHSSRRLPNIPLNSLNNFYFHLTGESLALNQFLAIAGLSLLLVVGIVYIIRTH